MDENVKLTVERDQNKTLAFWTDVYVWTTTCFNHGNVYWKATFTNQCLNWDPIQLLTKSTSNQRLEHSCTEEQLATEEEGKVVEVNRLKNDSEVTVGS